MNELRSHMTSADSEKVEMQERIKILDTDITSKQVCCTKYTCFRILGRFSSV